MQAIKKLLLASTSLCLVFAGQISPAHAQGMPSRQQIQSEVQRSMSNWGAYQSPRGFRIKFPKSWDSAAPATGAIAFKYRTLNGLVTARVVVQDLPPGTTLQTCAGATFAAIKTNNAQKNMPITVLNQGMTQMGGCPAAQELYSYTLGKTQMVAKALTIVTVKDGRSYTFNYAACNTALYDAFLQVILESVKSLQFT